MSCDSKVKSLMILITFTILFSTATAGNNDWRKFFTFPFYISLTLFLHFFKIKPILRYLINFIKLYL